MVNQFERDAKVSLQDRLQKMAGQPFSLEETFTILDQLGQALCYAHRCNVIYGNLKPETILFKENGDVLRAEFFLHALATQHARTGASPVPTVYQAPELLPGQVSKLGDQYALGCMAYEMLTGNKPFQVASTSRPDAFYRTKKLIPPRHFNPTLSLQSEEAILKAMAKEPTQRHRDISCFLTALGISTDTGEQTTSVKAVPVPLAPEPPEQADLLQEPAWYTQTAPTLDTLTPVQMVYSARTSMPAGAKGFSPDHHPVTYNAFADAIVTSPENSLRTSTYTGYLRKNSAMFFFKWRWIGVMITCLVAICIVVTSILALSTAHLTQGDKTVPAGGTKIESPPLTPTTTPVPPTPTPEVTPTTEQETIITPSPIIGPTATVQPSPTPRHGHH